MSESPKDGKYSIAEYFEFCQKWEGRFEFVQGEIVEIESDTLIGNAIAGNVHIFFGRLLNDQSFICFQSSVRVVVEQNNILRIPDFVICDENGDLIQYVINPLLIVEVLADSTTPIDRSDKLREYLLIQSLRYYLLVEQTRCFVELYIRDDERWYVQIYDKMEDVIKLPYFNAELPLYAIYRKVVFADATSF